jgi:hypothetical protein
MLTRVKTGINRLSPDCYRDGSHLKKLQKIRNYTVSLKVKKVVAVQAMKAYVGEELYSQLLIYVPVAFLKCGRK